MSEIQIRFNHLQPISTNLRCLKASLEKGIIKENTIGAGLSYEVLYVELYKKTPLTNEENLDGNVTDIIWNRSKDGGIL